MNQFLFYLFFLFLFLSFLVFFLYSFLFMFIFGTVKTKLKDEMFFYNTAVLFRVLEAQFSCVCSKQMTLHMLDIILWW